MDARITAICRYPVKGFTPEQMGAVDLTPGDYFPYDRLYAVENGPSGFDEATPVFMPKQKFTVLASIPRVASARTRYDEAARTFHATAPGMPDFAASLADRAGRAALAAWLTEFLGDELRGPLRILEAAPEFRFTDHPQGHVSILNLASVRDLGERMGVALDPLRFRANLHVDGWPAWVENAWTDRALKVGAAAATVFKPIVRCAATHVDPTTAARDLDVTRALFDNYGHMLCGLYVRMTAPGRVALDDLVSLESDA